MPKYFYMLLVTVAGKADAKIRYGSNSLGPVTWPVRPKLGEMSTDLQTAENCLWSNLYLQVFFFPL